MILIIAGMVAMIGVTALAVDGGNAYADRRKAQNAADSAAMAGALVRIQGGNWVEKVMDTAEENGYTNDGVTNMVSVISPPPEGPYSCDYRKDCIDYFQVEIASYVETFFGSIVGVERITNNVSALVRTKSPEEGPIYNGYGVVSLARTSDCQNDIAFYARGEQTLKIEGAGLFVNSGNPGCALVQKGSGSIRLDNDQRLTLVGGASIQKPQLVTPFPPKTGSPWVSYPPAYFMPKVGCSGNAEIINEEEGEGEGEEETGEETGEESSEESGEATKGNGKNGEKGENGLTMSPGNWGTEDFPPEGVTRLQAGAYCLDGDFVVTGKLVGSGVVIYVKNGRVRISGSAMVDLSAPKKGDNAGLLIYLPIENKNRVAIGGNAEARYQGTILAPGAEIKISGGGATYVMNSNIIGYTIDLNGSSETIIRYKEEQLYQTMSMPEIQLIK